MRLPQKTLKPECRHVESMAISSLLIFPYPEASTRHLVPEDGLQLSTQGRGDAEHAAITIEEQPSVTRMWQWGLNRGNRRVWTAMTAPGMGSFFWNRILDKDLHRSGSQKNGVGDHPQGPVLLRSPHFHVRRAGNLAPVHPGHPEDLCQRMWTPSSSTAPLCGAALKNEYSHLLRTCQSGEEGDGGGSGGGASPPSLLDVTVFIVHTEWLPMKARRQ